MKKFLFCFMISAVFFTACKSEKENVPEEETLSAVPTELLFAAIDARVQIVAVESNVAGWSVTQIVDWIIAQKESDDKLSVAVKANTVTKSRVGTITIKAGNVEPVTITVTQEAAVEEDVLSVDLAGFEFAADDTNPQTVTVATNVTDDWMISKSASWIIVEKMSNKMFTVAVEKNLEKTERTGTIVVSAGKAKPVTIEVKQFANEAHDWATDPALRILRAFPGAEGFGANTTGGRGGKVLYVTRLDDDSNEGSLRWAVNQSGARIIMFKVAGEIKLKSRLSISNGNLTIAGHSAPGDGICISGNTVYQGANNVIIRYLRFRMGDLNDIQDDAIWGRRQSDIIIDHCSMSWCTDECASFYDNDNFTLQWCILSESLRVSVHEKGNHGYCGIWGGRKASFHHNLIAHHDSRNPRFCGSRYTNKANEELVDFRNNVIFNWGSNSGYAGEGGRYNMVGNYYKPGSGSSNSARIFQPNADDGSNTQAAGVWGLFYVAGNYMLSTNGTPNTTVINDNWSAIHPNPSSKSKSELRSDTEFEKGEITTHTAQEAFELVLDGAGASFLRDATDTRVVHETRNGLTPVRASGNGGTKAGLIDSQKDVGGWDTYTYRSENVSKDSDGDGIPDEWETTNRLNPNDPSDGASTTLAGTYTNLEVYLYDLLRK